MALSLMPVCAMAAPALPDARMTAELSSDTLTVTVSRTDSVAGDSVIMSKSLPAPLFYGPDGKLMVVTDDGALTVEELLNEYYNEATIQIPTEESDGPTWPMVAVIAICFGVPGIIALVALILILRFQRRKNRERHDIIQQAIDNNYPLPESFYTRQPSYQNQCQPGESQNGENPQGQPGPAPDMRPGVNQFSQQTMARDPRKLSSSITLIGVGLALLIAFLSIDNPGVAFVAGGIPLFIGIGRLVAYYYVPGYAVTTTTRRTFQPPFGDPGPVNGPGFNMPPQYPGQQQAPAGMPQPPHAGQQQAPVPPQFNGQNYAQQPPFPPVNGGQPQSYDPNADR